MPLLSTDVSTAQYVITVNDIIISVVACGGFVSLSMLGKSVARGAFPPFLI
jgi:hypothetical protein